MVGFARTRPVSCQFFGSPTDLVPFIWRYVKQYNCMVRKIADFLALCFALNDAFDLEIIRLHIAKTNNVHGVCFGDNNI